MPNTIGTMPMFCVQPAPQDAGPTATGGEPWLRPVSPQAKIGTMPMFCV